MYKFKKKPTVENSAPQGSLPYNVSEAFEEAD